MHAKHGTSHIKLQQGNNDDRNKTQKMQQTAVVVEW